MPNIVNHTTVDIDSVVSQYVVNRYKRERRAAMRNAKLRLSNIKLNELTQIMRGKTKQIKH